MGVTKISTFLYIKIFIVSIGLVVSYLIWEYLFIFTYDFLYFGYTLLHSWALYNTLGSRNTPKTANTKRLLFSLFSSVYGQIVIEIYACLCLHIILCIFITTFHAHRRHITIWTVQTRPILQLQNMSFLEFFSVIVCWIAVGLYACLCLLMIYCNFITPFLTRGWHVTPWASIAPPKLWKQNMSFFLIFQ